MEVNGSDAAFPKSRDIGSSRKNEIGRVLVSGYDTGLPHDDVESALREHFSSCGEITDVYIHKWKVNELSRSAYIYFLGEGAEDRALQLSGSHVGEWIVSVEAEPFPKCSATLVVGGYDTSLSDTEIKSALSKHFSSCGKVKVVVHNRKESQAVVLIDGEDAPEKAMELSVLDMGGRKVVATLYSKRTKTTVHPRPRFAMRGLPPRRVGGKAKTTAE